MNEFSHSHSFITTIGHVLHPQRCEQPQSQKKRAPSPELLVQLVKLRPREARILPWSLTAWQPYGTKGAKRRSFSLSPFPVLVTGTLGWSCLGYDVCALLQAL